MDSSGTVLSYFDSSGAFNGPIIGGTTSVTDSTFSILDDGTPSKIAKFQCSGITAATTRTFTFPDVSGTLPTLENAHSVTGGWTYDGETAGTAHTFIASNSGAYNGTGLLIQDNSTGFNAQIAFTAALSANRYISLPDANAILVGTTETANLLMTLKAGGAEVAICASNPLSIGTTENAGNDGDAKRRDRSKHGDHRAFNQHLLQHSTARSADRQAHGELVAARRRTREQEVGEIDCGNQQNQRRDAEQDEQRPLVIPPQGRHAG